MSIRFSFQRMSDIEKKKKKEYIERVALSNEKMFIYEFFSNHQTKRLIIRHIATKMKLVTNTKKEKNINLNIFFQTLLITNK